MNIWKVTSTVETSEVCYQLSAVIIALTPIDAIELFDQLPGRFVNRDSQSPANVYQLGFAGTLQNIAEVVLARADRIVT